MNRTPRKASDLVLATRHTRRAMIKLDNYYAYHGKHFFHDTIPTDDEGEE